MSPLPARRSKVVACLAALLVAVAGLAGPASASQHTRPDTSYGRYVALGDSYTAGPLIPVTDPAGGCLRSDHNYPSLLAERLDVGEFVDVSCSGADTTDMTVSQFAGVAPQFDALTADTDLVTVSIGGNDFSVFAKLVGTCTSLRPTDPDGSPCRRYFGGHGRDRLRAAIDHTTDRVIDVVQGIRDRAPRATVIVVGYPQIAPSHGTCPGKLPLAVGDYRYATQIGRDLNGALRQGAAHAQARYVNMFVASKGHDICASDPWINGQHNKPTRALAYHPFEQYMEAVADQVELALSKVH